MKPSQVLSVKQQALQVLDETDELADVKKFFGLQWDMPVEYISFADVPDWEHTYATIGPGAAIDETFNLRLFFYAGDKGMTQERASTRCFEIFELARTVIREPDFIARAGLDAELAFILLNPRRFREVPIVEGQSAWIEAVLQCQARI